MVSPARVFLDWMMLKEGSFNKHHMVMATANPDLEDRELVL